MNKNDSTLGLSPKRLAYLLGMTLDTSYDKKKGNSAEVAAQLLKARLEGALPLDTWVIDDLPAIIGKLHKDLVPRGGKTLGEVLIDPEADLGAIKKIRRYAKKMALRKRSEAEQAVTTTIYFAAIASALLFHDAKITTHSYELLKDAFAKLTNKSWMPAELTRLFAKACKACRDRR